MHTRIIFTAFFIVGLITSSAHGQGYFADSTNGSISLSANIHYGFVLAHRPSIIPLQQEHVKGFDISISKPTFGDKVWQRVYGYPAIGIKYSWFDLGDPAQLGYGQTIIPFIDFTISHKKRINTGIQCGWGIGYVEKAFDRYDNYKNVAIGSHINSTINFNFTLKYKISERTVLSNAIGITHFSNGSITTPNLGINATTIQASILHTFGKKLMLIKDTLPPFYKSFINTIYIAGAIKQIYPAGGKYYLAGTVSGLRVKQFTCKSGAGVGVDLFYDNSIIKRLQNDSAKTIFISAIRPGINGCYELIMSDFSLVFQMGVYVYTQLKTDGYIYHRIGMHYQFNEKYFICLNLKTHFAKADFFEWGIGMKF